LWVWAKEKLTTSELKNKFLLTKHIMGRTAWHDAAETNNTEVLEVLWEWVIEELTPAELNNKLLFAKDDRERTALHVVSKAGNTELGHKNSNG
jgi:ankyrin repeat protein